MDESIHATEIDEGTEVDDRGDDTLAALARLEVVEEVAALLLLSLLEPCTARQDHVVAIAVELDDLGLNVLANVGLQLSDSAELHKRCREEATEADVHDEATLDDLDDRSADDSVGVLDLLDVGPGTLVLCALLGKDQATLLVLLLENKRLDGLAERDDLVRVDVIADGQLADWDDALGLVADVEKNLVAIDLDDRTLDEIAILELDDRGDHRAFELRCAEVVLNDGTGDVVAF